MNTCIKVFKLLKGVCYQSVMAKIQVITNPRFNLTSLSFISDQIEGVTVLENV